MTTLQQVCNKLAQAKVRCVGCVVSFPKFHYDLFGNFPIYGEVTGKCT